MEGSQVYDSGSAGRLHRFAAFAWKFVRVKNKAETRLKAINMVAAASAAGTGTRKLGFLSQDSELDRRNIKVGNIRQQPSTEPLFEFSGACADAVKLPISS